MLFGARAATVLTVFGLAINSFVCVAAFPLGGGQARVVKSCKQEKTAALTFVRLFFCFLRLVL